MKEYINQLILTVVVCQTASMLAPENETAKRYLRTVCALVTILTIVSPVKALIGQAEEIGTHFASLLQPSAVETDEKRASFEQAAYAIFSCAEERYGFDPAGAEITFFTDEDGEADELMIFFESGSPADRDRLQAELEKELGILVHIFLERREADESGGEDGNSG